MLDGERLDIETDDAMSIVDRMVFKDDVHVIVDEGSVVIHVSNRKADVLSRYKLIRIDNRRSRKVVNDPVMMILQKHVIAISE